MSDEEILYPDTPFSLVNSLVILGRRGSESHGTYIPSTDPDSIDDRDLMGICIPPVDYYLGMKRWQNAEAIKGPWDVVLYEFHKFIDLLKKQNPNVIGLLWLLPEDYLILTPVGKTLVEMRHLFRHRTAAYKSFQGYASSQLKKMQGGAFAGYMGDKRKRLVEKHGYDTKNAAHLIRLLHMGKEYLETGILNVRRTWDVELLIDVKKGKWTLAQVQDYAREQFAACERACNESPLPDELDHEAIDELVVHAVCDHLHVRQGPAPEDIAVATINALADALGKRR